MERAGEEENQEGVGYLERDPGGLIGDCIVEGDFEGVCREAEVVCQRNEPADDVCWRFVVSARVQEGLLSKDVNGHILENSGSM